MIGIYKVENKLTHQVYIGQSIHIQTRWDQHKRIAKSKEKLNNKFYNALREYGIDNFSFSVVEECSSEELNNKEIYWINFYDSYNNGYNSTPGGQSIYYNNQEIFDLWDEGYTVGQIAEILGYSPTTVRDYLISYDNYSKEESHKRAGILAKQTAKVNENISPMISVYQYSLNGSFLNEYSSMQEASNATGANVQAIGKCINGIRNSAGGYFWSNIKTNFIDLKGKKTWSQRQVAKMTLKGEILETFSSIKDAANSVSGDRSFISRVCKNGNTAYGYKWKYID